MSNDTCIAPECLKDIHIKKWSLCRSHYNRWVYAGDVETPKVLGECKHCGVEIVRSNSSGPLRDYCSKTCQNKAAYARKREKYLAQSRAKYAERLAATVKVCQNCGANFTPHRTLAQKFCSKKCAFDHHRDSSTMKCGEDGCVRPVRARKMCSMHYRRWARSVGNEKSAEWDDRRRANYQKRRALKLQLPADSISADAVYERDEWMCGICNEPVPRDSKYPDPLSPSIDHVLPLSKGGHHVMENVQLAHLECNVQKGNRIEADEMLV